MVYIAINGDSRQVAYEMAHVVENLGFKRNKVYTTQKIEGINTNNYIQVSENKIKELCEKGIIIYKENIDGVDNYVPEPFGATKFIEFATDNQIKHLKDKYGNQIKTIYIGENYTGEYDLVIGVVGMYTNIAKILRLAHT